MEQAFDKGTLAWIIGSAMDAIITVDGSQRIVLFNAAAEKMFDCSAEAALGQSLDRFIPERFRSDHQQHIRKFGKTQVTKRSMGALGAVYGLRSNGEEFPIEASISQIEVNRQKLFTVILRDITQRQQAQETLRQERDKAQQYLDVVEVMLLALNRNGGIAMINRKGCRVLGYDEHELIGRNWFEICIPAEELEVVQAVFRRLLRGEAEADEYFENKVLTKTGERRLVRWHNIVLWDETGNATGTLSSGDDITERRGAEEKLIEQAALLNYAQDAILVRSLDDRILFWNQGAERIYGWMAEEATGRNVKELIYRGDPSQFEDAKRAVIEEGDWIGELQQATKGGKEVIAESRWTLVRDTDGRPKSILAINTNITERKKLEAQFLRAQRLESIGTLASGIAHDLNNILSPITTGVQLLQMKPTDESSQRMLEVIRQSAERGGNLIKQVLSFARGGIEGHKTTLQLRHLIKEIAKVLAETLPKNITIKYSLPPDLATINGDPTQLHQVLMNLCVNARDAMPGGGTLTIAAETVLFDEHYARINPEAKPGPYVLITVTDTGTGIPPEVLDRIFDPFFTTKEQGKGTGLGLATVQGIVKSHGGFVNVYSEPGRGTQFRVYLLAIASAETAQAAAVLSNLPAGHGETILVVDDEPSVREIARTTLETFGYRVLTASEGVEAVALYTAHQDEIEAVLTDMMMPLMDGPAMIRELQKINPQVRIIASSGLAEGERAAEAAELGVKTFLPKPYNAEKLLKAIGGVIGEANGKEQGS